MRQKTVIIKCDRDLLQSASGITKCDRLLLQNASGITRSDSFHCFLICEKKQNKKVHVSVNTSVRVSFFLSLKLYF